MGRYRPKRQDGRTLALKAGAVLIGLAILVALGYAGGRIWKRTNIRRRAAN